MGDCIMARHIEGLYEIAKEIEKENDLEECYHRLVGLCDSIINIDEFPFALDMFCLQEKKEFLKKFVTILESDNPLVTNIYKAQKEKKASNKKICYTLSKENVDNSLDYLMKYFLKLGYEYEKESSFIPNLDMSRAELTQLMADDTEKYRWVIRHRKGSAREIFENCYKSFMRYYNKYISEMLERRNNRLNNLLESLYVLYRCFYLFADICLQSILYLLIDNAEISKEDKIHRLENIFNEAVKIEADFVPHTERADNYNIFNSFAVYIMYLDYRNTCKNCVEIQNLFVKQMENQAYSKEVAEEYQCKKRYLKEIGTKKELRHIILEGEQEKEERFNRNMEDIQHLIVLLDSITGRELSAEYLQHVKVVYREILEDDIRYNGKQARTIMRNIEKKEIPYFESEREAYFIREKISRGLMREKGYTEEYLIKNKIQSSLYSTILKLFTSYDELRIAKDARQVFAKYSKVLKQALEND